MCVLYECEQYWCVSLWVWLGCTCVQYSDGSWKETVRESASLGLDGPVESPRGQQIKQVEVGWRMGGVLCDCISSAAVVGCIDVCNRGVGAADELLHCVDLFHSSWEQCVNHTVVQYVRMLWMTEWWRSPAVLQRCCSFWALSGRRWRCLQPRRGQQRGGGCRQEGWPLCALRPAVPGT